MMEWPVYNPPETDLDDFQDMLESRLNAFVPFCLSRPPGDGVFNDDAVTARLSSPEGWLTLETGFSLTSGDRRSPGHFWACLTTPENSFDYHTMTVELNGLMDVKAVSMAVRAELGRLAVQDRWFRDLGFVCDPCLFLKYSLPLKLRGHDCVFEVERIGQDLYGTELKNGVTTDVSYTERVAMPVMSTLPSKVFPRPRSSRM